MTAISPGRHGGYRDYQEQRFPRPGMVGITFRFLWSPSMVADIANLTVEPRWLTSWHEEANRLLCPLFGWEPLSIMDAEGPFGDLVDGTQIWKHRAAREAAGEGRPVIWVDDDEASDRTVDTVPHLTIRPDRHLGLTPAHLASIADWAARQTGR